MDEKNNKSTAQQKSANSNIEGGKQQILAGEAKKNKLLQAYGEKNPAEDDDEIDLDDDGEEELYFGVGPYVRNVFRLVEDEQGWQHEQAFADGVTGGSDVQSFLDGDFDGDGIDTLALRRPATASFLFGDGSPRLVWGEADWLPVAPG